MKNTLRDIFFYITDGCNLNCKHCWIIPNHKQREKGDKFLPVELFRQAIDEAIPLGLIGAKLTGGEPCLHPQLSEMLDYIQEKNLFCNLETNGVLCYPDLAKKIAVNKKLYVAVSLDGPDEATHEQLRGVTGSFNNAVQGIRNLVAAGVRTHIVMSLTKYNKDKLSEMVKFAESLGVRSIKFNPIQPVARGEKLHSSVDAVSVKELINLGRWVDDVLAKATFLRLSYDYPMAFRSFKYRERQSFCSMRSTISVLADGSYALCGIGTSCNELIFGHVSADVLEKVWNESAILKWIRADFSDMLEGVCGRCLMRHLCRGKCVAANFYEHKRLSGPNWFCTAAYKEGLFPESRLKPLLQ